MLTTARTPMGTPNLSNQTGLADTASSARSTGFKITGAWMSSGWAVARTPG